MTPYDPQIHHRRSMRLKHYDYSLPGAYFITLVTFQRDELFGEVVNGEMQLSALGKIVHEEWMRSIQIRKEIRLNEDEFIIMPNHVHGIVWIVDVGADRAASWKDGVRLMDGIHPDGKEGACHAPLPAPHHAPGFVGADGVRPMDGIHSDGEEGAHHTPHPMRMPRSVSAFVAGFKAVVTKRARLELNMEAIWQRNFYDHIIRDKRDFMTIWQYIDDNPRRWQNDQLHPSASVNRFNRE